MLDRVVYMQWEDICTAWTFPLVPKSLDDDVSRDIVSKAGSVEPHVVELYEDWLLMFPYFL
jgi:hypothetical protein